MALLLLSLPFRLRISILIKTRCGLQKWFGPSVLRSVRGHVGHGWAYAYVLAMGSSRRDASTGNTFEGRRGAVKNLTAVVWQESLQSAARLPGRRLRVSLFLNDFVLHDSRKGIAFFLFFSTF